MQPNYFRIEQNLHRRLLINRNIPYAYLRDVHAILLPLAYQAPWHARLSNMSGISALQQTHMAEIKTHHTRWCPSEDCILIQEVLKRQPDSRVSWKIIHKQYLPSRTPSTIRNRYYRLEQGRKAQHKQSAKNRCKRCGQYIRGHLCGEEFDSLDTMMSQLVPQLKQPCEKQPTHAQRQKNVILTPSESESDSGYVSGRDDLPLTRRTKSSRSRRATAQTQR